MGRQYCVGCGKEFQCCDTDHVQYWYEKHVFSFCTLSCFLTNFKKYPKDIIVIEKEN